MRVTELPTKAPFWRTFLVAMVCFSAAVAVEFVVVLNGDGLVGVLIGLGVLLGSWAAIAPRGAAIGLSVLSAVAALDNVRLALYDPWRLLATPFGIVAFLLAVRSITLAARFRAGVKRRASAANDYDRMHTRPS